MPTIPLPKAAEFPHENPDGGRPLASDSQDEEKAVLPPQTPGSDVPDGGLDAWLVVLGTWCASFCSFGWLNSIGVFQAYYEEKLLSQYSSSTVSWIPSLQIFFMMGMGPIVGHLYDRHGPRWLLIGGTSLHIFGIMMCSLGTEYYQILLAQGVCSAIGVSALFQPAVTCLSGWFYHHRAASFGIAFTGSSVGGVLFPIMVSRLIGSLGFGWAMRICAFLMLGLLVVANLTIRMHGLPPQQQHPSTQETLLKRLMRPLKEVDFVLVAGGLFLFCYGYYIPINFLQENALAEGMHAELAQYLLPMLNAGSLFGRLAAGFAADKIGRFNVFLLACVMSVVWVLALWLADSSDNALIAFAVLFGFFSGSFVSLMTMLVMAVSPMSDLGFRMGLTMLCMAVGGLTTNPINGAILQYSGSFVGVRIFSGVFCAAGTVLVASVRIRRAGWTLTAKY